MEAVQVLGCRREGFPQTYLGLPLSNEKLRLSAFAPLISKFDKYLAGWQAALLNQMARTVLVNAVLDSLPTYAMMAMQLPPGVIAAMDAPRRSFLWSGEDKTSGADCLVAWEQVTMPKDQGGLGVRDLAIQNRCLFMKLVHRLHVAGDSSWSAWVNEHGGASNARAFCGEHWDTLRGLLPAYRELTTVQIGDGASTTFWLDDWHPLGRLSTRFPALFSHMSKPEALVPTVLSAGVRAHLVPRLTAAAASELRDLEDALQDVTLQDGHPDSRRSFLLDGEGRLRSAHLYKLLAAGDSPACTFSHFVWRNCSPPRVQFFMWLLVQERIKSRALLLVRHVVVDSACELCLSPCEDAEHIIFGCAVARSFWAAVGVDTSSALVRHLWELDRPASIPIPQYNVFIHLCCWNIWKHRNEVVFRHETPSLRRLLCRCQDDALLWRCRMPQSDSAVPSSWCDLFNLAM